MTILDNSSEARRAISRAIQIAQKHSTALVIIGIDAPFEVLTPTEAAMIDAAEDYVRIIVEHEMHDVAREAHAAKVPITYRRILRGNPLDALLGAIDVHQPQLLVVPGSFLSRLEHTERLDSLRQLESQIQIDVAD